MENANTLRQQEENDKNLGSGWLDWAGQPMQGNPLTLKLLCEKNDPKYV